MNKFEKILEELKDWLGEQWEDGELDALVYNIIDICENDDTETNSLYQTKEVKYDYDEYTVFILGFDNFELSQYIRMNPKHYGADEIYDFCVMIAKDFEESEENKNLAIGQYTALERFLNKNTLKYMEIYDKGEF